MSGIIHKVKEAIAEHKEEKAEQKAEHTGTTHNSHQSSNYGPHDSNVANAADPRVDSDRSKHHTSTTTGPTATGAGLTGTSHNNYDSSRSSNHGPHDSNIANAADPRVDSDRSKHHTSTTAGPTATGAGLTGTSHNNYDSSRSSNHGPHDSNIANAADPRVDSDRSRAAHHTTSTGPSSTLASGTGHTTNFDSARSSNYGPHDSNIANAADPRVDSDRSAYNTTGHHSGAGLTGTGHHSGAGVTGTGLTGTGMPGAGMTGTDHHSGARMAGAGMTGAGATGSGLTGSGLTGTGHHSGAGMTGASTTGTGLTGSGVTSTGHHSGAGLTGASTTGAGVTGANAFDSGRSSNYGPHDSNIANTVDPRVDSDLSNRHGSTGYNTSSTGHHSNAGMTGAGLTGAGVAGAGMAGAHHHNTHNTRSSNYGPHDSNIANTADPRVDSDLSNRHGSTGVPSTHSRATGPASSTAGPHESNLANKVDPRVDSDLSKEKTHHSSMSSGMHTGGNPNTTTKSFEQAQKTAGVNPHVSSDGAGAGSSYNHHGSVGGSTTTTGPHNSSIGNKVDPRVDSDLDNSATVGHQRI